MSINEKMMKEFEKKVIQQNFMQLVVIAYLNRLAELTKNSSFLSQSLVKPDDDLASVCEEYIVYDDREGYCIEVGDGTKICPIITQFMYDEEHGLNATRNADTLYGSDFVKFTVVLPADAEEEPYVVCQCQGLKLHIVVEGGRWYSGEDE